MIPLRDISSDKAKKGISSCLLGRSEHLLLPSYYHLHLFRWTDTFTFSLLSRRFLHLCTFRWADIHSFALL